MKHNQESRKKQAEVAPIIILFILWCLVVLLFSNPSLDGWMVTP